MGHYASEMGFYDRSPIELDRIKRSESIKEQLADVSLSRFTAKELPALYQFFEKNGGFLGPEDILTKLETAIIRIREEDF